MREYPVYLVSDATGETVNNLARACLAQFDGVDFNMQVWPLVRTRAQVDEVLEAIGIEDGIVLCTMVDVGLKKILMDGCASLKVPCIPILDPIFSAIGNYVGVQARNMPGIQHAIDSEYFDRIEAINFVLAHDDGQAAWNLNDADVVVLGVSRTSKTPTCFYLAQRGVKAANIPVVPGCPLPKELDNLDGPLVVGLTRDAQSLIDIRRNRLRLLNQKEETDYVDPDEVAGELRDARRLFTSKQWPVIDVSRRSIEETAATILQLRKEFLVERS